MQNENRLIRPGELIATLRDDLSINGKNFARVRRHIDNAPTVDAVEVVRCKDCKHFVQGEHYDPCECMKWKVKWGAVYTTPDGYCHKGERKDHGR